MEGTGIGIGVYGDGVGDIDISATIELHNQSKLLSTVTATQAPGRFGALELEGGLVKGFVEKPLGDGGWINGGFFVLSPQVLDYIEGDNISWESDPMLKLAQENQMNVHLHRGFWQPMDTLRERNLLEDLWRSGKAPWKIWQ